MELKRESFDARPMSGDSGIASARVLRAQHVCGLRTPTREQARTGEITGEKVVFRSIKWMNRMGNFSGEKIAKNAVGLPPKGKMRAGRADIGNKAGPKSPAPDAQAIELVEYSGVKKIAENDAFAGD